MFFEQRAYTSIKGMCNAPFFRKIPVMLMNREELDKLPGTMVTFNASYKNEDSSSMSWPGERVLQLKTGCKVMVITSQTFLTTEKQTWDPVEMSNF